jgi:hypothetical protein
MTVMSQPDRNRTLVHLVNASGHADTAYFEPIEMRDVSIDLAGDFAEARPAARQACLTARATGPITLPRLGVRGHGAGGGAPHSSAVATRPARTPVAYGWRLGQP